MSDRSHLDGHHMARGVSWELGFTNNNQEQIGVLFEITQGEHTGERATWYGFFTDKSAKRTLEGMRTCGWDGASVADPQGLDRNEVDIEIVTEEYEGKVRTKVAWVNAPGVAMSRRMTDAERSSFAQRMQGLVMATKTGNGPAPLKPAGTRPAPTPPPQQSDPKDPGAPPF